MNRFLPCLLLFLLRTVASAQERPGYMGITWDSPFPVIERHFPEVEFIEEDPWHVTLFRLSHPEKNVKRVEFKLFENKLISVTKYYSGTIDHLTNENYIRILVSGLGPRKEVRKTTSKSLAGTAHVTIYEYPETLILFRSYPPGQKEGFSKKENSIVIIHKPTFDKMIYYRKHEEGEVEEIVDYDYIEF